MAELLQPKDEFIKMLEEYPGYDYVDFGNGLVFVFMENEINVRQYHNDGTCLSSWVKNEEFYSALNSNNKRNINIKNIKEEDDG